MAEDSSSRRPYWAIRVCAATSCIRDWGQSRSQKALLPLCLSLCLTLSPCFSLSIAAKRARTGKNKGERRNLELRSGQNKSKASDTATTTAQLRTAVATSRSLSAALPLAPPADHLHPQSTGNRKRSSSILKSQRNTKRYGQIHWAIFPQTSKCSTYHGKMLNVGPNAQNRIKRHLKWTETPTRDLKFAEHNFN